MSKLKAGRAVQVTIGLGIIGGTVGGVLGVVLVAALMAQVRTVPDGDAVRMGAVFGGTMGAVLAPIAGWTFMRDVPIWRAIAETALGTLVGAGIGLVLQPIHNVAWLSPPLLGIGGFVLAALRLRFMARNRSRVSVRPGGQDTNR